MKKLLPIAIAFFFAINTHAQNTPATSPSTPKETPAAAPANTTQPQQVDPVKSSHDQIMMRGDKLWVAKDGQTSLMTSEMTLSDGTRVMTDGTYITRDGKKMKMENGDIMNMEGKLTKRDMPGKVPEQKAADGK